MFLTTCFVFTCGFLCFRTLLVQMVSAAGTGYCFNTKRGRLRDKLVLRKHDPIGEVNFFCHCN
uniref:Large ribosomal subunit protein bL33m n=1 Tax=Sinocyclocheilus grahami TaxID=75366 RepID=A0A672SU55_SINGR